MCFVNKSKCTKYYKSTASPNNFKKDPYIIKLHTNERPEEERILSRREIYDHQEMFEGGKPESFLWEVCEHVPCVCKGSSRLGRGAHHHVEHVGRNHIMTGVSKRAASVPLAQVLPAPCLQSWRDLQT